MRQTPVCSPGHSETPARWTLGVACAIGFVLAAAAAAPEAPPAPQSADPLGVRIISDPRLAAKHSAAAGGEAVHMQWRLTGFLGLLVGLFFPNDGDALLTFDPAPQDRKRIQLLITAPGRDGEYFLYGADVAADSGEVSAVWSSHAYKDKHETKSQRIAEPHVLDFASAVYLLGRNPPKQTTVMSVWNHGKLLAAEIEPLPPETRRIGDERVPVQGYAVRGAQVPGQKSFDEKLFFYFTAGDHPRPLEILASRGAIRLRMRVVDPPEPGR